jgi:hypothetical protein
VRGNQWLLRSSATTGVATQTFVYGDGGADSPVFGNWDGFGGDGPGIYRNGVFHLRNSMSTGVADISTGNLFGMPIAGDWDGDGRDDVGVVNDATPCFDGPPECNRYAHYFTAGTTFEYGNFGDLSVVGDWNGDGVDTPAVIRGNQWFLRNSNSSGVADVVLTFGNRGDIPIAGDWDGDGIDTPAVVRGNVWFVRNQNSTGIADTSFVYGDSGDTFLAWE